MNLISFNTYIHPRPKSMFKHGWYNFREYIPIGGVEIHPAAGFDVGNLVVARVQEYMRTLYPPPPP